MNILTTLDYNIKNFGEILDRKKMYKDKVEEREKEVEQYTNRLKFLKNTKEIYLKAVDVMYEESVGVLQDTLNMAMQYVMRDKDYSVKLELEDKRGSKTLNLALIDNIKEFEADLKDSTGGGVRTIISLILKLYYLSSDNSHILLLDEKLSAVSASYVGYLFEFIQRMCDEKGFIIVLISHDPRFTEGGIASRVYNVADGVVTLVEDNTSETIDN